MKAEEFEKYLKDTEEALKKSGIDEMYGKMAWLAGWMDGSKGKTFMGWQVGKVFRLAYK